MRVETASAGIVGLFCHVVGLFCPLSDACCGYSGSLLSCSGSLYKALTLRDLEIGSWLHRSLTQILLRRRSVFFTGLF